MAVWPSFEAAREGSQDSDPRPEEDKDAGDEDAGDKEEDAGVKDEDAGDEGEDAGDEEEDAGDEERAYLSLPAEEPGGARWDRAGLPRGAERHAVVYRLDLDPEQTRDPAPDRLPDGYALGGQNFGGGLDSPPNSPPSSLSSIPPSSLPNGPPDSPPPGNSSGSSEESGDSYSETVSAEGSAPSQVTDSDDQGSQVRDVQRRTCFECFEY
jgi:hypothetical protein